MYFSNQETTAPDARLFVDPCLPQTNNELLSLFQALSKATGCAVAYFDTHLYCRLLNGTFAALLQQPAQTLLGQHVRRWQPTIEQWQIERLQQAVVYGNDYTGVRGEYVQPILSDGEHICGVALIIPQPAKGAEQRNARPPEQQPKHPPEQQPPNLLRHVIDAMPCRMAVLVDRHMHVIAAKGSSASTTDHANAEGYLCDRLSGDLATRCMLLLQAVLYGETPLPFEVNDNGVPTSMHCIGIADAGGQVVAALLVGFDESRRKRAEDATTNQQALATSLAAYAPVAMFVQDLAEGRYLLANALTAAMAGVERQTMIGKRLEEIWSPELAEQWRNEDRIIAASRQPLFFEEQLYQDGTTSRTFMCVKFPLFDVAGEVYAIGGICSETTDQRRFEHDSHLFYSNIQETQRLEHVGLVASGIVHDFNNLLTVTMSYAELIRADLNPPSDAYFNSVALISSVQRANELVRQILGYVNNTPHQSAALQLNQLIRDTAELIRVVLRSMPIDYALDRDLPLVHVNAIQMRQVLLNLLLNAVEAGGSRIHLATYTAHLSATLLGTFLFGNRCPAGTYVCLEVGDTGQGMDEHTLQQIFTPFFSTKVAGRGLGLAVIYSIVRDHGGAVAIRSTLGDGTTFQIWLPVPQQSSIRFVPYNGGA